MIEFADLRRELERQLIATARRGGPVSIEILVRDPNGQVPEVLRLEASRHLERLGLADVPVTLLLEERRCGGCRWHGMPRRGQDECPTCGEHLAVITGPPVEVHVRHG